MYYVYILKSKTNPQQIYIGSTNNLALRIKQHNSGKVYSTKKYLPWALKYYEAYDNDHLARLREK